jgi:D-alanyl-D-alanine carboxypeptidase (penicillin-binding protein 5/6)
MPQLLNPARPPVPRLRRAARAALVASLALLLAAPAAPDAAAEEARAAAQLTQAQLTQAQPQHQRAQPQRQQPQRQQGRRPAQPAQQQTQAQAPGTGAETTARQALILDFHTGAVMFDRASTERMAPSSMTKMLTLYVIFEALREGRLSLNDELPVSERAWRMQGSKMFVMVGTRVKVDDLLRGVIVQSGNDACIVFAEALSGSEEAFAEVMNATARRIGMTASNFRNASGWPDPDHWSTARDLATLARRLIVDFPEYYPLFSERVFTYNGITQPNRDPLLGRSPGADGIKTGHTDAGGYGLTASAIRDGRRIILVVNGLATMRARSEESERLIDWAYREYANYTLFRAGAQVEQAQVWMGQAAEVPLVAPEDVIVTLPRRTRPQLRVSAVYDQPVRAPIRQGQEIGRLLVSAPGIDPADLPLVAGADVERLGAMGRVSAQIGQLLWGARRQ